MIINAMVEKVDTKQITLKNGPRAGASVPVYVLHVDGKQVDIGFKNVHKVGDMVYMDVTDTPDRWGKFKLIAGTTITSAPPKQTGAKTVENQGRGYAFPIPKTDHATSICRQNALTAAVNLTNAQMTGATVDDVLNIAAQFAKWTTGQAEMEEAERIIMASTHEPNA